MRVLSRLGVCDIVDEFLRDAIRERHWTIPQFAEACDVATGLAQKWVSVNPRYRSMPGPASCEKIAKALGVDLDYVLELAGHRKGRAGQQDEMTDPRLAWLLARWPKLPAGRKEAILALASSLLQTLTFLLGPRRRLTRGPSAAA